MEREIAFEPPPGWTRTAIAPPALSAPEVVMESWEVWRAPDDQSPARVAAACVGVDLQTWSVEATPIAMDRLGSTVGGALIQLGSPGALRVEREDRGSVLVQQWLRGTGELAGRAAARTLLGFTTLEGRPRLHGCFVVCSETTPACEIALDHATATSAFVPPPAPNAALRALVLAVHHARAVALSCSALFLLAGIVAVWRRPRPLRK